MKFNCKNDGAYYKTNLHLDYAIIWICEYDTENILLEAPNCTNCKSLEL